MATEATHQIKLELNDSALIKGFSTIEQKLSNLEKSINEKLQPKIKPEVDTSKALSDLKNLQNQVALLKFDKIRGIEVDPTSISKIKSDITKAVTDAKITPSQANSLFSALNSVVPKIPKIKPEIDTSEAQSKGRSFGSLFGAGVLSGLVTSGIKDAFSKALDFGKSASDMENYRAIFGAFLGTAEKGGEMLSKIYDMGAATPFQTKDLATSVQTLLQYNVAQKEALGLSAMLGDASGGNAEKLQRMAYAYGQVNAAGKANMGDINQMINAGFNPLLEMANQKMKKLGGTAEQYLPQIRKDVEKGTVSVQDIKGALISATSEGGKYFGVMDAQSKTVSGRLSTLADQFTTVGMAVMGVAKTGQILEGGLFFTVSKGVDMISGALGLIDWSSIGQSAVSGITTIMTAFGTMASSVMLALAPLQGFFGEMGNTIGIIATGSLQVLVAGFTGLMGAVMLLNITIAPLLTTFFDLANMILPTLFNWLSMIAGPVAIATAAFFAFQGVGLIMAGVSALVSFGISGIIGSLFTLVGFIGLPVLAIGLLALAWQTNFMGIQELTVSAIQSIGGFLTGGFQGFLSGTASFLKSFVKFFNDAFVFTNRLLTGFITGCLQGMAALNTGMTTALTLILETVVGGFQFMVKNAFNILAGFVTGVAEYAMNVGNVFAGMIDFASGLLTGDWSKMVSGAGKTFGGLVGMVLAPAKAVVGIIESAINNVIKMINGVVQNSIVQEVLKKFGANVGKIDPVKFDDNFAKWANKAQAGAEGLVAGSDAAAKATERLAQRQSALNGIKNSILGIGEGISKAIDVSSFTKGLRDGSSEIEKMVSNFNKTKTDGAKKDVFDIEGTSKGIDEMTTKLQNMAKSAGEGLKNFKLSDMMKNPLGEFQKKIDEQQKKSQADSKKMIDEERAKVQVDENAKSLGKPKKGGAGGSGGVDKAKKEADKIQKEADKQVEIERKAQEDIEKLKAQTVGGIGNPREQEMASAEQNAKKQIDNFKGTEAQKNEYAKLMREKLKQDEFKINEKYAKLNFDELKTEKDAQERINKEKERISDILQKSKIEAISNTQTRELEMAKFNSQNILSDFKGTESQKAEFAKSQAQILEKETSDIKKKFANENTKTEQEIKKAQIEGIINDQQKEIESAKLNQKNAIEDFKGTEAQKNAFKLAEEKSLQNKLSDINQKYADKDNKEKTEQQKNIQKQQQEYQELTQKLEILQQKQSEYTDKIKESAKMRDTQEINNLQNQLNGIGTASFGFNPILQNQNQTQNQTATAPNPAQAISNAPQNTQSPQPQTNPSSLGQPIADTMKTAETGVDSLSEKLKTGISGAIEKGAENIAEKLKLMDTNIIPIFTAINENWISIAQSIGQNFITGLINELSKGERSVYSAIANLDTNKLFALNTEKKSRTELGEAGRGAAMNVPSVVSPFGELKRGFAGSFGGNNTSNNLNINQLINNNNSESGATKKLINNYF